MTPFGKHPMHRHRPTRPRAFTLVEALVVFVIITILAALIFVAVGAAIRSARRSADQQYMRSMGIAIEQFKQQFGFLPPLADDANAAGPVDTPNKRIRLAGETLGGAGATTRYLRYEADPTGRRYSEHSLAFYLLGVLPKEIDGVDGAGFTKPLADGTFERKGAKINPIFDPAGAPERIATIGGQVERTVIYDRQGVPFRYYRWLPTPHAKGSGLLSVFPGAAANDAARDGEVRSFNIPPLVGDPLVNQALRSAGWAIVSAGLDRAFDEANPADARNRDNLVIVEGGS